MKKAMKQSTLIYILNGVSIFSLLITLLSVLYYGSINSKIQQAARNRYELTYNANRFMNGSAYLTNEVRAYAATGDKTHYDNYWNEINVLKNRDAGVAAMKEIGITPNEQSMIEQMSSLSNELVPLEENAMDYVSAGNKSAAVGYVYGDDYNQSVEKINKLKSDFLTTLDKRSSSNVNSLILQSRVSLFLLILSVFITMAFQVIISQISRKKMIEPVIDIMNQMREIASGRLSVEFNLDSDTSEVGMLIESIHSTKKELRKYIEDIRETLTSMANGNMAIQTGTEYKEEFKPIQDSLQLILESLNRVLHDIEAAAEQVSASSNRVSSFAQTLSQGATEQAASVEVLNREIDNLSTQLTEAAQKASISREESINASGLLRRSNQMIEGLSGTIREVSSASSKIGGIAKIIEDIAFQTNILALNAAVEAARAGEAGKGFAVVADEVRNLATKSSEAAKDTTALINDTLKLIDTSAKLTTDTAGSLADVMMGAEQATDMVGDIVRASEYQREAIHLIQENLNQITDVVQNNVATAEASSAAAEELNHQAEALKQSTQRFILR
ncbi:methyl-accepting chemotaxis protein [Enterocloster sp. OA13]|uniref:methyl-accepting chemotaxis protein n=1 Tax=Enterocloster sp. OA13 TaxID=2914161 RepID=UPI00046E5D94|nr:methyl-accepting chemotaxis protein [Enterocloster sp. OA13]